MPIDALIQKYCALTSAPMPQPGEFPPRQNSITTMRNHRVEAFVDGVAYFTAIEQELSGLLNSGAPGRFCFLSSWWLGLIDAQRDLKIGSAPTSWTYPIDVDEFMLPGPAPQLSLWWWLVNLATAGVTVRVMGWVNPLMSTEKVAVNSGMGTVNFHTLLSVAHMRQKLPSSQQENVILNTLAHPMGATHCKLFVCGDQNAMRAYVSGLDPAPGRLEPPDVYEGVNAAGETVTFGGWHDVGVRLEGTAAGTVHDFFQSMWNEQLQRPVETFTIDGTDIKSHDPAWRPLISRDPGSLPANAGQQYVQVLRTAPQMNFGASAQQRGRLLIPDKVQFGDRKISGRWLRVPVGVFAGLKSAYIRRPLSFAPKGAFEFKVALRQAISQAENFIFIADQGMHNFELMDWINERKLRKPALKVILLYGADPNDPPNSFIAEAVNSHLIRALPRDAQGRPIDVALFEWYVNAVHCKVTIVDDTWCAIGSANAMRRSLYTDMECSVAVIEDPTPAAQLPITWAHEQNPAAAGKTAPTFVQRFRRDLWAHYCGIPLDPAKRSTAEHARYTLMLQLNRALRIWRDSWGGPPIAGVRLRTYDDGGTQRPQIVERALPVAQAGAFNQADYDRFDADSRYQF